MEFRIERYNGEKPRTAATWDEAVKIAEAWVGDPLYQGASNYTVDWNDEEGERRYGYATDFWLEEEDANRQMSVPANVVIVKVGRE